MLQRTNYNPGDNELLELISNNSLNRNQDIADMLHLLMNIDKGLSIFLDGDWGSGKTYFVRSLKIAIDILNTCPDVLPAGIDMMLVTHSKAKPRGIVTIYRLLQRLEL